MPRDVSSLLSGTPKLLRKSVSFLSGFHDGVEEKLGEIICRLFVPSLQMQQDLLSLGLKRHLKTVPVSFHRSKRGKILPQS